MVDQPNASVVKALFVRLLAQDGKANEVEAFLRSGLAAVIEEPDTTTWYAVRFGDRDFAIFDTFPSDEGRLAHLTGKVGRALIARTPDLLEGAPTIEHAQVLATNCRVPAVRCASDVAHTQSWKPPATPAGAPLRWRREHGYGNSRRAEGRNPGHRRLRTGRDDRAAQGA